MSSKQKHIKTQKQWISLFSCCCLSVLCVQNFNGEVPLSSFADLLLLKTKMVIEQSDDQLRTIYPFSEAFQCRSQLHIDAYPVLSWAPTWMFRFPLMPSDFLGLLRYVCLWPVRRIYLFRFRWVRRIYLRVEVMIEAPIITVVGLTKRRETYPIDGLALIPGVTRGLILDLFPGFIGFNKRGSLIVFEPLPRLRADIAIPAMPCIWKPIGTIPPQCAHGFPMPFSKLPFR